MINESKLGSILSLSKDYSYFTDIAWFWSGAWSKWRHLNVFPLSTLLLLMHPHSVDASCCNLKHIGDYFRITKWWCTECTSSPMLLWWSDVKLQYGWWFHISWSCNRQCPEHKEATQSSLDRSDFVGLWGRFRWRITGVWVTCQWRSLSLDSDEELPVYRWLSLSLDSDEELPVYGWLSLSLDSDEELPVYGWLSLSLDSHEELPVYGWLSLSLDSHEELPVYGWLSLSLDSHEELPVYGWLVSDCHCH